MEKNNWNKRNMRQARERSESGIYHVILRGINRQDIFYDDEDYQHFLETINQMKSEDQFIVYGYCLMSQPYSSVDKRKY
jgi:REP element-mobilizing transposase RayT